VYSSHVRIKNEVSFSNRAVVNLSGVVCRVRTKSDVVKGQGTKEGKERLVRVLCEDAACWD